MATVDIYVQVNTECHFDYNNQKITKTKNVLNGDSKLHIFFILTEYNKHVLIHL